MKRIFWADLNYFDLKTDKSTFIEICKELAHNGYQVCFMTSFKKSKFIPEDLNYHFQYIYVPAVPFLFRPVLIFRMWLILLKKLKPGDLLICQPAALALSLAAKKKKSKVHLDFRTLPCDIVSWKGHLDRYIFWTLMLKWFLKKADSFSFITETLKSEVEKEFKFHFPDDVIWSSAVNTELFKVLPHKREDTKPLHFFYHGHITIKRGILTFINAFAQVIEDGNKDIFLTIAGDGPELEFIKKSTDDLGIKEHVRFLGLQPYEAMPGLINEADICVSPLPNRIEWNVSSPLKVFEYLACGKPVLLTPIPAHRDVLGDMDGIIYTKGDDEKAFVSGITEACEKVGFLQAQSNSLRDFVSRRYTWEQQGKVLIAHLRKVYAGD